MAHMPCTRRQSLLDCQAATPLASSGLENSPSAFLFHPRPKSMLALAAPHFGLPCPFRHSYSSLVRVTTSDYTPFFPSLQICDKASSEPSPRGRSLGHPVIPRRLRRQVPMLRSELRGRTVRPREYLALFPLISQAGSFKSGGAGLLRRYT
jgi:hypothetical protein